MGRLTVLIGCMFAQKTTELLRRIRRYKSIGYNVVTINYGLDQRYGTDCIASHDKEKEAAISVCTLSEVDSIVCSGEYDVIVIDEGQFYKDLHEYVTRWADEEAIHIVVAGLSGSFEREPLGDMLRLIPHAEEVEHLTALCAVCCDGTPAPFTKRITEQTQQILIGAKEYMPVCRKHYMG
jgi:thymidine kinase